MATFNKFNCFVEDVTEKVHNLGSDTLKVMLTNSAPVATNTVKANLTEISAGNGYTAGGVSCTISSSGQTNGTYKLVLADPTITAAGGSIGPFQYAVLYNDTSTNDSLIGWLDYGSAVTLLSGDTFTVDFDATNGVLTLSGLVAYVMAFARGEFTLALNPAVLTYSGTLTLSGSGFGTKATAAPLYFSTFENATLGAAVTHSSVGLEIINSSGADSNPHVVNTRSHSGTQCIRADYQAPNDAFRAVGKTGFPAGCLNVFVGYWTYIENVSGTGNIQNYKWDRAGTGVAYSGNPKFFMTVGTDVSTGVDCGYHDGVAAFSEYPSDLSSGQWIWMETRYRLSTAGSSDGWLHWYWNTNHAINHPTLKTRDTGVTATIAWAMCNIDGADQMSGNLLVYHHVDELLIDSTHARVIATDNATYASSTKWAPQAPTTWSDTEITIATPNWSNFTSGSTAYFHVFDANDTHVSAFARTVP